MGDRPDLPRLDLRRAHHRGRRAGQVPDARAGRRQRRRHRRRGRASAGLPQRLSPPRRPPGRGDRGQGAQAPALPLPRLVLRPPGRAAGRPAHGRGRGLRLHLQRLARGAARRRRRPGADRPLRRGAGPRRARRRPDRAPRPLPVRRARARRRAQLRGDGELEGDRRELQRVPALPRRAPGAERAQPLHERRRCSRRGVLVRRLDDPARGRLDDGDGGRRPCPRRRPPADRGSLGRGLPDGSLLRPVPERARLAASRLRDAPHPVAARGGRDLRHLRVVLRAPHGRARRLRPVRRGRLLGHGQQAGLVRVRADAEGGAHTWLFGGPLLGRGERRPRVRPDGGRPLHGGVALRGRGAA